MASHLTTKKSCVATRSGSIRGTIPIPGDKSISHRALLLGSQIIGNVTIKGLLEGEDVLCTKAALQGLGVSITKESSTGNYHVKGVGIGGLSESTQPLNMGNSGTGARLLMGLVAPYPFTTFIYGDESLSGRPMNRVIKPLTQMGAQITARSENRLPVAIHGSDNFVPIHYESPVASAQVKSCILLAGLNTAGTTTVIEPKATRDHTERMMQHMSIPIQSNQLDDGRVEISLNGHCEQKPQDIVIDVPADPSSAAFPIVTALVVPDSDITVQNVCMNPLRIGLFDVLKRMGADISFVNERTVAGEPVVDIHARHSQLKGIEIEADIAPSMIDEYPILSVAAAFAEGQTVMHGLAELRVKESNRFDAIIDGLTECGVQVKAEDDTLIVTGGNGEVRGGGSVITHFDHRIAMSFLVMGLAANSPVIVDDYTSIATSFPGFIKTMTTAGAYITQERRRHRRISRERPFVVAIDGPAASGKGTLARR
ncbi:MAG: 3-phosphoshikimate 1-carboxyvinyltransferase, partial [Rickettsiales bacterium]|nr:3-phosphoshikimate 1-carboxyvinyltransferase [Rickettsiales bacterium]